MRVFLLKDVEKVGMAGEIIDVKPGFARNYLIAQKIGIEVRPGTEQMVKNRVRVVKARQEVISSKAAMLAEDLKNMTVTIQRKMHDNEKLYGTLSAREIADALSEKGVKIAKNQVVMDKSIKSGGEHSVTIKLSTKLKPSLTVRIIPE